MTAPNAASTSTVPHSKRSIPVWLGRIIPGDAGALGERGSLRASLAHRPLKLGNHARVEAGPVSKLGTGFTRFLSRQRLSRPVLHCIASSPTTARTELRNTSARWE